MKKVSAIVVAIFFCSGLALLYLVPERNLPEKSPYRLTSYNKDKKKILIFSSRGGGGHISATDALIEYLEPEFCVGSTFVFSTLLQSVDLTNKFRLNKKNSVDSYNFLIQRNWNRMLNFVSRIGSWYFIAREKTVNKILEQYLITHKPNLIISVAPIVNNNLLTVAQKLHIPFLLIPTDLDGNNATLAIKNPSYDKFRLGLSYEDPEILKIIAGNNIDKKYISYIGFPVKSSRFAPQNPRTTKKIFGIPEGKPVILLMMGSQGSGSLYEFSKQIAKIPIPSHLIIVLGKSNHLMQKLHKVWFPKHISHTILGFTNHIPELMSITNLLITKSGSVTVNEGIYGHVPMLLDATSTVLQWEQFNHHFIKKHGLGNVVKKSYRIPQIVTKLLSTEEQARIKMNFALFDKKNPKHEIRLLVKQLLSN
jgi:processive 1,2-diacylglycerol beta-glucosyltransferase